MRFVSNNTSITSQSLRWDWGAENITRETAQAATSAVNLVCEGELVANLVYVAQTKTENVILVIENLPRQNAEHMQQR